MQAPGPELRFPIGHDKDSTGLRPFIIISGEDIGQAKRERISKVRSHIATQRFQRLRRGREVAPLSRRGDPPFGVGRLPSSDLVICEQTIPRQVAYRVPFMSHPFLDPTLLGAETKQRMQKCT